VKCLWSWFHPGADCNSVESGAVGAVADRSLEGLRASRLLAYHAPGCNSGRRYLIAALSHIRREPEAKAKVAELLLRDPECTLARTRANNPFRHEWMITFFLSQPRGSRRRPSFQGLAGRVVDLGCRRRGRALGWTQTYGRSWHQDGPLGRKAIG
jgi:hypothetical protein